MSIRSTHRRFLLTGAFVIIANYMMIYGFRHLPSDDHWCLGVERYHLLPQFGLLLILIPAMKSVAKRFDARPIAGWFSLTAFAFALLLSHRSGLLTQSRFYEFPDQPRTLSALDHLSEVCRHNQITRGQAVHAMDPIRRRWFEWDGSQLFQMIAETAHIPQMPDSKARATILTGLTREDKESLWGGMDLKPYWQSDTRTQSKEEVPTVLERMVGMMASSRQHTFVAAKPGCFLEYRIPVHQAPFRSLQVSLQSEPEVDEIPMSIWWSDRAGSWSVVRSAHWLATSTNGKPNSVVELSRLPHWSDSSVDRLRFYVWKPATITLRPPTLIP